MVIVPALTVDNNRRVGPPVFKLPVDPLLSRRTWEGDESPPVRGGVWSGTGTWSRLRRTGWRSSRGVRVSLDGKEGPRTLAVRRRGGTGSGPGVSSVTYVAP